MTPLTALIVAHGHPELSKGGAEIAAYQHFQTLKREFGVRAVFLAWREDGAELRDGEDFSPFAGRDDELVFHADGFDRFCFTQPSGAVRAAFARLMDRLDCDVAHFHHYVHTGLDLIAIARRRSRPLRIVVTLHDFLALCHNSGVMVRRAAHLELCLRADADACARCFPEREPASFVARRSFVLAHLSLADAVVSPSRFLRDRYVEWGLDAGKTFVVDNGSPSFAPPPARRRRSGEDRNVFGYFGQIHPYKGLLQLLQAFAALAADPEPAPRLVIHGAYLELNHPRYVAEFELWLARCGSRVQFAGAYERARLPDLMADVDWVVIPSIWWENAPLVIEEALACRRPVLCSDIGGMREKVRDGFDGVWFPVGDVGALAAKIRELAQGDETWRRLRSRMRRPLSVVESMRRYLDLYCVSSPPASPQPHDQR